MKNSVLAVLLLASSMLAKDKGAIINIQVLSTQAWTRTVNIHHRGSDSTSTTDCSTNGTASDPGGTGTATINANTNCNTTTTPGTAPYTTTREIQQETVHAVLPDGRQVTLWCQRGFRDCRNLPEGTYRAQIDGASVLWIFVPQLDKTEKKIKYKLR
jgi:hypothetical protein